MPTHGTSLKQVLVRLMSTEICKNYQVSQARDQANRDNSPDICSSEGAPHGAESKDRHETSHHTLKQITSI